MVLSSRVGGLVPSCANEGDNIVIDVDVAVLIVQEPRSHLLSSGAGLSSHIKNTSNHSNKIFNDLLLDPTILKTVLAIIIPEQFCVDNFDMV
jgi:hypothetical protein